MTLLSLVLLVGAPVACGVAAAALPRRAAHAVALAAMLAVFTGVASSTPSARLTVAETTLGLHPIARLELGFLASFSALVLAYHFLSGRMSPLPVVLPETLATIAAGTLFGPQLLVAASFLLLASLLASLLMIGEQPDWQSSVAGAAYLVLAALGGVALLFGFVLADLQRLSPGGLVTVPFVVAVITVGLALQLGAAPLHFWVPNAFQRAGPVSLAVAVGVLGPATVGLLLQALAAYPQLVVDERVNSYLTAGGLFTAAFGAFACLARSRLRRRIGYAFVSDLGIVLAGMATYTRIGVTGAALHLAQRSVVALLLAAATIEIERGARESAGEERAAPYLWSVALVGMLSLAPLPPLGGFAGAWAVFQALALSDWRLAAGLAACSFVCLGALLSGLAEVRRPVPLPWRGPSAMEWWLMALAALAALWGLAPGPLLGALHAAVSQLPFLKPF